MSPKVKSKELMKANSSKIKRNKISISEKMKILKKIDEGMKMNDIANEMNLGRSTILTIKRNKEKIQKCARNVDNTSVSTIFRPRNPLIRITEIYLHKWIIDERKKGVPLSGRIIQQKALSLYEDVKKSKKSEESSSKPFTASNGWFERYKKRFGLKSVHLSGESASANSSAASDFIIKFKQIVAKGNYSSQQIFNVDETGLFWKKMPSRTYISQEEKYSSGFKKDKDRLTLLLGGNVRGDIKLKPMLVYRSENPRALKNIKKDKLPVLWKSNKKAWVTQENFREWFNEYFAPFIEKYNESEGLENKALLILDNCTGHADNVNADFPNIEVVFLPPNTTSLLQPMDMGVISTFKAYYLRRTIKNLLDASSNGDSIRSYWKSYNIKMALENIKLAWDEVTCKTMNGVWKELWPEGVVNKANIESDSEPCQIETVELFHEAGFNDVNIEDIKELLETKEEEQQLTNDELLQLDFESYQDIFVEQNAQKQAKIEKLSIVLEMAENIKTVITEVDDDNERCEGFKAQIDGVMYFYKKLFDKYTSK